MPAARARSEIEEGFRYTPCKWTWWRFSRARSAQRAADIGVLSGIAACAPGSLGKYCMLDLGRHAAMAESEPRSLHAAPLRNRRWLTSTGTAAAWEEGATSAHSITSRGHGGR